MIQLNIVGNSYVAEIKKKSNYLNKTISSDIRSSFAKLPSYNTIISFYGLNIKPANRLSTSDYANSSYINEISKARWLHGDQAIIELAMGNPDITPPEKAKTVLKKTVDDLWSHRYNYPKGEAIFRNSVSEWFQTRFGINIDPASEVMLTAGASDALDTILNAYTNKGDKILIPDPGYSVYKDITTRNDVKIATYDLKQKNNYLPDFDQLEKSDLTNVKAMILNYPHNPTGVFATKECFEKAVKFAKKHNILLIHDFDNSEVTQSGKKPIGIMQTKDAKDVAFEIHTFSKAHNMPGLRVGFLVSNKEFIDNAYKSKLLDNTSVYTATQYAAATALLDKENYISKVNQEYRKRKNTCVERLKSLGSTVKASQGTYYLWVKIPEGFTSEEFFKYVLHKAHVAFTPGSLFGKGGEGNVRIVMSADSDTINKAFDNIEKAGIRFDVPKQNLPLEIQQEIDKISKGNIGLEPKAIRDLRDYKLFLQDVYKILENRFARAGYKLDAFKPDLYALNHLPINILKDRQKVYLHNARSIKPCLGEIKQILPFSKDSTYDNLNQIIQSKWFKWNGSDSYNILPIYHNNKLYSDATYFTIWAYGDLQAIANLELQDDGYLWLRGLNTAPWNQGETPLLQGAGTAILARAFSFCLETNQPKLKLSTNNPKNIKFYKNLGMQDDGIKNFGGVDYKVLSIDQDGIKKFLNQYQKYLSY